MEEHYRTLDIPFGSSQDVVRKAYLRAAKGCHPDTHPGDPDAGRKFQAYKMAYEAICNENKQDPLVRSEIPSLHEIVEALTPKPVPSAGEIMDAFFPFLK